MSARVFLQTPVLAHLAGQGFGVTFVTRDVEDSETIRSVGVPDFRWRQLPRPFRAPVPREAQSCPRWLRIIGDLCFTAGFFLHLSLVYRFNKRHRFRGFVDRLNQSWHLRRLALREGLALSPLLGFPFPSSRRVESFIQKIYYSGWQRHPAVERIFEEEQPNLLVLGHLQTCWVTPFALAALARTVPILGVNGSWDQPTTKGPLCPGVQHILVQSRQVAMELTKYHGVQQEKMSLMGWPQMDVYVGRGNTDRKRFLEAIGVPHGGRYLLVGAYSERLGGHEPKMCAELGDAVRKGRFGSHCTLYVRPHPLDFRWRERLSHLYDPPHVVVEAAGLGDLDYLADLIRHAGVVIASAGTINLDAVALDVPSIAIAWENEDEPYYDRPARRYDMEHYAAVVRTGGIRLVKTMNELEAAVAAYLESPDLDAAARRNLRERHLDPLDGRSSERLVDLVAKALLKDTA